MNVRRSYTSPVHSHSKRQHEFWHRQDTVFGFAVPRNHRFTFFRVGVDECAKCGKTRKEHKSS